ncbi:hypothetical protein TESG_02760 [Trichophyton tonsurans CBS 112818]|uniref:Uncharacterized protein n=1 Tax=Trichophyton tonsurans (strain CBS 112818) TaxID=647933 RepID=F2RVC1_TRIT1|nr:hypothetical protein TESG_02760 [Trichophyton tonsurans CBS 112818]
MGVVKHKRVAGKDTQSLMAMINASTTRALGAKLSHITYEKYAALAKRDDRSVKDDRKHGRHYLSLLEEAGPGDVTCLDLGSTIWTREVKNGEVELALGFRRLVLQARNKKSQELEATEARRFNFLGAKLIIEGFLQYGWDYKSLSRCQSRVMMALFEHIDSTELANGNIEPKKEDSDRQSISGGMPPFPQRPNYANRARKESTFNPQMEASSPPNSPENNVDERPSDYEPNHGVSSGGGGAFDGIPFPRCEATPYSSPSPSAEGDAGDYGPHSEGDLTDSGETTASSTYGETSAESDYPQGLDMLIEATKAFAKVTNKRLGDNGSRYRDSQRRRLNEETEANKSSTNSFLPQAREAGSTSTGDLSQNSLYSAAEGATQSRQQLLPVTQPSQQLGDDARQPPSINNTHLPNTAPLPTEELFNANQNFGINPSALDKPAIDQSPRRTTIPTTNTNTNIRYDPYVGASPSSSPMPEVHYSSQQKDLTSWSGFRTGENPAMLEDIHTSQYSMLADIDTSVYPIFGDNNLKFPSPNT